jgi:hypothetical protein
MAVTSFIPQVWSAGLLENFSETTVAAGLVNRSFEGDAKTGNQVKITGITDITIGDYAAASRQTTTQGLTTSTQALLIDQERYYSFKVDDVDKAQAAGSMDAFTRSAATGLAEVADKFILSTAVTGALAGNVVVGTAALTDGDAAWDAVRDMRKAMNKAHVPQAERRLIVNAEFEALLLGATAKLTGADTSGSTDGLRNAALGRMLGFDVYVSENLPVTDRPQALAFHASAVAFADQISEVEAIRSTDSFADVLRGLHVYGAKVVRSAGIAVYTDPAA